MFTPQTPQPLPRPASIHTAAALLLLFLLLPTLLPVLAQEPTYERAAQDAWRRGDLTGALSAWQQALGEFQRQKNSEAEVRTSLSIAGAYQGLGHQRAALEILEETLLRARSPETRALLPLATSRLGAALAMTRETDRALTLLNEALELARASNDLKLQAETLNDLGNLHAARQRHAEAMAAFESGAALARQVGDAPLQAQILCNAAVAALRSGDTPRADALNAQAIERALSLPTSHATSLLLLTAGQTDLQLTLASTSSADRLKQRAHRSLLQALDGAATLGDRSIETYALGYLGRLYELDGQRENALSLTRRATFAAQQAQAPEALYRWEWQSGRLLKAQSDPDAAIAAYRRAVQTLGSIRNDVSLGHGNAAQPGSFRENQGPLYLELADLLLMQAGAARTPAAQQALLREARDTVEELKTVELNDYFCDDCVDLQRAKTRDIEAVDAQTAVVYLIPLPDRTETLLGLSQGLYRFTVNVGAAELKSQVTLFRRNLETRTTYAHLAQGRQLYDWLIRPIRPFLAQNNIHTLVFVPDGALRTIPLASLHDGERFLIQDLAVAVAPGLSLVDPQSLARGEPRLLLSGVSKPVQDFPPLSFVPAELQHLAPLYPSKTLLDESFTLQHLRDQLDREQYSIIHIASHGQFDRDVRKTFVLTYDTKLTLNTLESLIRPSQYRGRPVELLVLSACQTAAGDDRAALGLAGVALKAGARSALATLWFVNDESTSALVTELYSRLRADPTLSKARALQAAQVKLLTDRRYRHPCYWSPFLIIGNWL